MRRLTAAITHEPPWYVARCLEVEVASQGTTIEESLEEGASHLVSGCVDHAGHTRSGLASAEEGASHLVSGQLFPSGRGYLVALGITDLLLVGGSNGLAELMR